MNVAVVCTSLNDICALDEKLFYGLGLNVSSFISIDSSLEGIKSALKYSFETSEGVFVIYSKHAWSNLQKAMLMEFERSSVFVDAQTPYVIANGFRQLLEGVYFDRVYEKPFVFISNELKEDVNLEILSGVFGDKLIRIGIFDENIQNKHTVFRDEVETIMIAKAQEADKLIKTVEKKKIYTLKGESPQRSLFNTLKERNVTVSLAESCTAGMIASSLADIPGASGYFMGGCVTYSNEFKRRFIGVNSNTLNSFGAVSKEVATQMAVGVLNNSHTDFSVAVTGIAGPSGGSVDKPVGLVYVSVASRQETATVKKIFSGNRRLVRHKTTKFALLFLRDFILSQ